MNDKEVRTVGKLRAITAQSRAVDAVEVWVYLPNTRGPVKCYIAGHTMRPPAANAPNVLTLQIRPVPVDPEPEAVRLAEPDDDTVPFPVPVAEIPDRGAAGKKTDHIPNEGEG